MRRRTEEEINIFNYSFLDILSCTIGALIFILLMIILSTTDLVEKKLLDDVTDEHAETLIELSQLEQLVKERQAELSAKDRKIASLLTKPGEFSLDKTEAEAVKTDIGQDILTNTERKNVTSAKDKIYLGSSRNPISTRDGTELNDALKQFLRYYDDNFEEISWTIGAGGNESYDRAFKTAGALRSIYGDGLKAAKEKDLPDYSKAKNGSYAIDTDKDGINDVLYIDKDKDGKWDERYINTDRDKEWEEIYQNYNSGTGSWGRKYVDSNSDGKYDLVFEDRVPGDSDWEIKLVDPNLSSGKARERYEDKDNNGVYDTKLINTDFTDKDWEQVNSNYDLKSKRWKISSIDTNNDGDPDIMWGDMDMSNNDWEEKWIDQNFDGKWDLRYKDTEPNNNIWEALYSIYNPKKDIWKEVLVDVNSDGSWDMKMTDENGDGEYEKVIKLGPAN